MWPLTLTFEWLSRGPGTGFCVSLMATVQLSRALDPAPWNEPKHMGAARVGWRAGQPAASVHEVDFLRLPLGAVGAVLVDREGVGNE